MKYALITILSIGLMIFGIYQISQEKSGKPQAIGGDYLIIGGMIGLVFGNVGALFYDLNKKS